MSETTQTIDWLSYAIGSAMCGLTGILAFISGMAYSRYRARSVIHGDILVYSERIIKETVDATVEAFWNRPCPPLNIEGALHDVPLKVQARDQ